MKKIVTNFVGTKGGNYKAQEDLKNAIIKEFNLPDDWTTKIKQITFILIVCFLVLVSYYWQIIRINGVKVAYILKLTFFL